MELPTKQITKNILSKIRHDLTNPINAIIGYSQLLLDIAGEDLISFKDDVSAILTSGETLLEDSKRIFSFDISRENDLGQLLSSSDFQYTLRIPLTTIIGLSEYIHEDKSYDNHLDSDEIDDILIKIKQAGKSLLKLINDLNNHSTYSLDELIIKYEHGINGKEGNLISSFDLVKKNKASSNRIGTVLIVDDEPSNLEILNKTLIQDHHEVLMASNASEASMILKKNKNIDVILLDLIMPGINGMDFLKNLKSDKHTYHIPVIMLSALDEVDTIVECINTGAEDFLMKPVNRVLLSARLNNALEKKYFRDKEVKYQDKIKKEQKKSENLLLNILPSSTAKRLKSGETLIADDIEDATVLFADIPKFTSLSSRITAKELVMLLNNIFSKFDEILSRYSLEKIKTIGDNYMLAGGIPNPNKDHAKSVALMALEMIDVMPEISEDVNHELEIRIGMNSGPLSAGVIGKKKFVYDLWGDTVNVASRMETSGKTNKIHVSEASYLHLKGMFNFVKCEEMDIPGKGMMQTYFLTNKI